ncbi:MAG: enoyl-CoA hydratase/isomerase family protein [Bacillota bacterium]
MTEFQNLTLGQEGAVLTVTFNRPEVRNALDPQTWAELRAAVRQAKESDSVSVVILTGAGAKAFASGADIRAMRDRSQWEYLRSEAQDILLELENLPKPVIAAINGFALGGGCEVAMAADIRIAADHARFGQPEVALGILPSAGGTQRLARLVGFGKAKELIMTGEIIDAAEAMRIGLVNQVVPAEELLGAARAMAEKMLTKAPLAVGLAKLAVNLGMNTDIASGLAYEKMAQALLFTTEDKYEGMTAFIEKRPAQFKGR